MAAEGSIISNGSRRYLTKGALFSLLTHQTNKAKAVSDLNFIYLFFFFTYLDGRFYALNILMYSDSLEAQTKLNSSHF